MRIWHEDLIPKLCQPHLCAMWREGLGCYKIITENLSFTLSSGEKCLVSSKDKDLLKWTWRTLPNGYVVRSNNNRKYYLHREITKCPDDMVVDHKNGNKLDNRRENLRICTISENTANQKPRNGTSKYKGVNWDKSRNKWLACIRYKNKTYNLGRFNNEKDGAIAYDKKALELWGEFAYLNFGKRPNSYINHPATQEFEKHPTRLYFVLEKVRFEMLWRNYHPKEMPEWINLTTEDNETKYIPWQTYEEQVEILRAKGCKCNI